MKEKFYHCNDPFHDPDTTTPTEKLYYCSCSFGWFKSTSRTCPACRKQALYGPLNLKDAIKPMATAKPEQLEQLEQTQVGGSHYKRFAIQPSEFIHKNNLGWCEGNVIKYVCRHSFKNKAEDIRKAIHYLELLLKWVYGEKR